MSLLSETKTTVAQTQKLIATQSTDLSTASTLAFPISSGQLKQKVGLCELGSNQYAPVIDLATGLPMEMPQGYIPMLLFFSAEETLNNNDIGFLFSSSPTSFANIYEVSDWLGMDINYKVVYNFGGTWVGSDFIGRNFLCLINYDYPTVTTGVVKAYFLFTTPN